jgi:hypothetical protein
VLAPCRDDVADKLLAAAALRLAALGDDPKLARIGPAENL